jgi:tetratricopeptide (TPR) repeat protein
MRPGPLERIGLRLHRAVPLVVCTVIIARTAPIAAPTGTPQPRSSSGPASSPTLSDIRARIDDARYADAQAIAREALRVVDANGGACSIEAGELCIELSKALRPGNTLNRAETLELSQRAVEVLEGACGEDDPRTARAWHNLGSLYYARDEYELAQGPLEHALVIRERTLGPMHPDVAMSLVYLATLAFDRKGDAQEAHELFDQARVIQDATLPPVHADVAWRFDREGMVDMRNGDLERARDEIERALAIRRAVLRPGHPLASSTLSNLGVLFSQLGEYGAARAALEEALELRRAELGPAHRAVAKTLAQLARMHEDFGDRESAIAAYRHAIEIALESGDECALSTAAYMRSAASLSRLCSELVEARRLCDDAIAILRERDNPLHPEFLPDALAELGYIRIDQGDLTDAHEPLDEALDIAEHVTRDDALMVRVRLARAALYRKEKNGPAEHEQIRLAAQAAERANAGDDATRATVESELAASLARQSQTAAALDAALHAEELAREHVRATARALEERLAWSYASTRASGLDTALSIAGATRSADDAARAWDAEVRSRALVFDEMAARNRAARASGDALVAVRVAELARARKRLSNLAVREESEPSAANRAPLATARAERDAAERALAEASAPFRRERESRQAGLDEVRAALPKRSALVAFACYLDVLDGNPSARKYAAFVLANDAAAATWVPLGAAEAIDACVAAVVHAGRFRDAEIFYARAAAELRVRAWDPIAPLVAGAERVFIVPDGALHFVNFAALPLGPPDVKPGAKLSFVIEHSPPIHYLSAERDLVRDLDSTGSGHGLLAVGAPDYEASIDVAPRVAAADVAPQRATLLAYRRDALGSAPFPPLPQSAIEVATVAGLWSASHGARATDVSAPASADERIDVLTGRAATESEFKRAASGHRVLHLATHGFCLGDDTRAASGTSRGGSIASSGAPVPNRIATSATGASENAMLLSGVVFAGVNRRAQAAPDADDGVLTAEEITALDLSGVEWAVLSACDTGLGEARLGEGLFGLRRAFQLAGVRTVITSSWPVADADCRAWMEALYDRRLIGHADTARAMRETALQRLAQLRANGEGLHPAKWCGFTAAGDWR